MGGPLQCIRAFHEKEMNATFLWSGLFSFDALSIELLSKDEVSNRVAACFSFLLNGG